MHSYISTKNLTIVLMLSSLAAMACADGCSVAAAVNKRPSSSWTDDKGNLNQIYDITITNTGSCPITHLGLQFDYDEGAFIADTWNLLEEYRHFLLQNFGESIPVGKTSVGAGIVISTPAGLSADVRITIYGSLCPRDCAASSSSSVSASASAPDLEDSSVASKPEMPASPSVASISVEEKPSCLVKATLSKNRKISSWLDREGRTLSAYELTVTNIGSRPVSDYTLQFDFPASAVNVAITSLHNLERSSRGAYSLPSLSTSPIAPGATFTGAGLVIADAPDVDISINTLVLNCN